VLLDPLVLLILAVPMIPLGFVILLGPKILLAATGNNPHQAISLDQLVCFQ